MRRTLLPLLPLLLAACLAGLTGCAGPLSAAEETEGDTVRGIIVSTHTDGRDWASDHMQPTFRDIRELGAGWVAIHPYAAVRADGSLRYHDFDPRKPPDYIARPIATAHELGLRILIKPHLAYWRSPFKWRGEIAFRKAGEWQRFWRDYEDWIVTLAAATSDADGFVIGTELDRTLDHEATWRRIVRRVREQSGVPLTYAPNWSEFERVPFWDALDAIGVQAYFPLADAGSASEETIRAGWEPWLVRLRRLADEHDLPVVFTELGYNRSLNAPVEPWAYETDGVEARAVQERCMRVALQVVEEEPRIVGAFLWKWFPEPHSVGRNFQLATPGMRRVIREAWLGVESWPETRHPVATTGSARPRH